jgi:antitoxin component YwqK of YwqJK toxin-antitoxin module
MKKIECKYCGWSWNESDGGDDKYMCHMCDNDNSKYYLKESEESKKGKLFIPRRLSGENSRFIQWNKEQPIVDGVQINQYTHDGKQDGIWEYYWDNGQLKGRGSFKNGKKEGIWERYHKNGSLRTKELYDNDLRDGTWESYWDNGQLHSKGSYKDGKEDGIWEEYYENGQLWSKDLYKDGKYVKKLPLTESEQSKKGKLFIPRRLSGENSRFIQWNKEQPIVDGVQINQYTHDGKKTGIWEFYYDNGQLEERGSFKDGKKEGYWEEYWDNGQLHSKGLFKNGKLEGYWESYYGNGQLRSKDQFKNGKQDGIWETYHENGKLRSKGLYKNGKQDGIWEWYWSDGQLSFKDLYKDGKYVKKLPLTESEQSKKGKLFIPRRLSGENSRFIQWNKEQPIVDGVQINQYTHDGKPIGYWDNWVDDNDILVGKGLFVKGKKEGYWEEYLDGELVGKGSYKNGKESGTWEFYEDGEVYRKELFQSGKLVGRWYPSKDTLDESEQSKKGKLFIPRRLSGENSRFIQWNKEQPIVDGVQINQYTHDGKKTGIWEDYYDGKLNYRGSFKDGEKDGIWETYYGNGKLSYKGSYKNDKKDGTWEFYYYNGNLEYRRLYNNGKYVKELPITESEQSKKGKLFIPRRLSGENSRFIQWNKEQPIVDGERINQYTHDGKKDGIWEEYWDENGQLESKGLYKDNKKTGIWEDYYDNGQLWSKVSYKDDIKTGIWESYYENGQLESKGSYKNGLRDGIWEYYYDDGQLKSKGSYKDGNRDGIWEWYYENGQLKSKGSYKDGKLIKRLPLTESEQPKKGKLFIPRRIEGRWDDYLKSTITTDYNMDPYLKRRDLYRDNSKNINPLVMKLSKGDLITFVKANPFWLDSMDKVKYLLNTLNYKENKDIAENHIGQTFTKSNFWTSREMNYYENKFKIPKSNYGKIDIYVFVGSDEFVETRRGSYKKKFDIERLMKVSVDDWKDTKDYGLSHIIKMMRLRASSNNKQLYKISAHKGLLDDYDGETGSEIPDYILMSIDEKKERL